MTDVIYSSAICLSYVCKNDMKHLYIHIQDLQSMLICYFTVQKLINTFIQEHIILIKNWL